MNRMWLSPPHMGGNEFKYVAQAFESNWIAPVGPFVSRFEEALALKTETRSCAALSSGTAAIHLALLVLGVKAGDEVVCSSFTFIGSCNPVIYLGATPIFVDSEPVTLNMSPELLEEAIEDRIKKTGKIPAAVILVHLYGMPAAVNRIIPIARKFGIPVIEDAAEALGSKFDNKPLGSFGDVGVLSFNGNKIITTSGGGALVSNDDSLVDQVRFLATQAKENQPHYEHSRTGFNYRLSNVCAAIGVGQLEVLDQRVDARRANFNYYRKYLTGAKIEFPDEPEACFSNRWLTTVFFKHEISKTVPARVRKALESANIESRPLWKPMHLQPIFRDAVCFANGVSEKAFQTGLCLPSGTQMTSKDLDRVISIINDTIDAL